MNRLFVTGDTHGEIDIHKLSTVAWPRQAELTKDDYLIILGDFGFVWSEKYINTEEYWLKWLNDKPFTTLFIAGNHECYPRLRQYPKEKWNGGYIRKIRDSIFMLEHGQIFNIGGKTIFAMGGAKSIDRVYRKEGVDWWPEEMPSQEEYEIAVANLEANHFQVDYILTHCGPTSVINRLTHYPMESDELTQFLDHYVNQYVSFKRWYIGHYHIDRTIDDKYYFMYDDIMEI